VLYAALILEDNARKAVQAATLGALRFLSPEECQAFESEAERRVRAARVWSYFAHLEARWDRQPASGRVPLA
jgi:hypothetical protein